MFSTDLSWTTQPAWLAAHLREELLPRWREAAVTPSGLFLPDLDRQWRRTGSDVGTLVSQGRLIYNFAQGYRLTGETAYLEAVQAGARFLVERFRDPMHDGYVWSCASDGRVVDDHKNAYGHAFVLFGLAHAFGVTGDVRFREAAWAVWNTIETRFRDAHGGLAPAFARDFTSPAGGRSQNPVMHLFEALLTAAAMPGLEALGAEAARVADFVLARIRTEDGALPELYTEDWRPLLSEQGGRIDIGHQFEWAYLLSQGVAQGLPEDRLVVARRLLDWGLRMGEDPDEGGIFSSTTLEGELRARHRGWWEQCEAARALLRFAAVHDDAEYRDPFERTVAFLRRRLYDPEYGGWYMRYSPEGEIGRTDKGNVWKVDYHVVGLCIEAIRVEARER